LNILFVTEDHSIKNFGVTTVVSQLANEIANRNNDIQVFIAAIGGDPVQQSTTVTTVLILFGKIGAFWRWSPDLINRLNDIVTRYQIDLIHIHGIWMAAQWAALKIANRRKIPCIVSSHAMLEEWYWNKQGIFQKYKKKIYFNLVFKRAVAENTMFHAITPIEKDSLRKLLPKQRIVVVPNAISISNDNHYAHFVKKTVPEKIFLFLGRIHPVKGVDLLVKAFCQANLDKDWKLVLAGPELVPQYAKKIREVVKDLGISSRVVFSGPLYGTRKQELLHKAWALVFPSYCEVMGMVNLEASACRVPSITTFETGLWDWEEGGGLLIHPNVDELAESLLKVSRWTLRQRLNYGNKSFNLVANKYSWKNILPQWETLYKSLTSDYAEHRN
jgi:glycosyltransferase involved in cell wall biosynthesis